MNARVAGEVFDFRPPPPLAGASSTWRPLDHAVARWVLAHGGSPRLALIAAWASYAEGQGDSAVPLEGPQAGRHGMPVLDAAEQAALAAEPMVTTAGGATAPFVLDNGHFYLRRNHRHEVAVTGHLNRRRLAASAPVAPVSGSDLDALFQAPADAATAPQREAVRAAPGRRLFVLTGGPGTGKTTTVLRMLLTLGREHHARRGELPVLRISAPTGKAAQRLGESLRNGAEALLAGDRPLPPAWRPHLDNALAAEAGTLHRLLGSRGHLGGFRHHAEDPVPADIVVVDEASMVDLAMLRALLDGLREDAVLVLVGDADQLTSVGTGSVLLDLVGAMEAAPAGDLVRLQHCFRADTALVPVNEAVRRGDRAAFAQAHAAAGPRHLGVHAVATPQQLGARLGAWAQAVHVDLEAAGALAPLADHGDPRPVLRALTALRQRQLLCALREGPFGAEQANARLETTLCQRLGVSPDSLWYPGRAVMVTRNDAATDLFNGDVGLCLADAQGNLQVWFEAAPDPRGLARPRAFAPGSLPAHQGAFAVTVHKSQGSEYDEVALLLPPDARNAILSRQLLYTGLTRARRRVQLWATAEAVDAALGAAITRSAALRQRLGPP